MALNIGVERLISDAIIAMKTFGFGTSCIVCWRRGFDYQARGGFAVTLQAFRKVGLGTILYGLFCIHVYRVSDCAQCCHSGTNV